MSESPTERALIEESVENFKAEFRRVLEHIRKLGHHETNITPEMDISTFDDSLRIAWTGFKELLESLRDTPHEQINFPRLIEKINSLAPYIRGVLQELENKKETPGRIEKKDFLEWINNKLNTLLVNLTDCNTASSEERPQFFAYLDEDLNSMINNSLGQDFIKRT